MAPCLREGVISAAARSFVESGLRLGASRDASVLRISAVPRVFEECERLFASAEPPLPAFARWLEEYAGAFNRAQPVAGEEANAGFREPDQSVFTAAHYGELFKAFGDSSYWEEPAAVLRQRLERNGIDVGIFKGQRVLDAGCGGGRYSAAWSTLGAGDVTGVDFSSIGVNDARRRLAAARIPNVSFQEASVLALPFPDDSFDVAFSNGVLHHTADWEQGVRELVRVLRPGGFGWLYLIEDPGGLHWDSIEILRVLLHGESPDVARAVLAEQKVPPNRIFYMLDHVMVPINVRLTTAQIEGVLAAAGAKDLRRLSRGCSYDRIERIHEGVPYAGDKYGVAEHRFVFTKD